ncbi:hypothetical protein BCON_0317g00020 [Botryotinia convoluta]|uniref:Uncharacterized protein n=1 Tax=Botryotinia convoluta TaxID=54673 RepID=A0A4Z1HII5_9HELO|nr:hypothetical protein BCON_0317g00020 [Botryotinia convoluta]
MSLAAAAPEALSQKEKREQKRARISRSNCPLHAVVSTGLSPLRGTPQRKIRDSSSPTGKLWLATLDYISTIQGCMIRYRGTEATQDQEFICVLVQSDNAKQWSIFQQSLGISMLWEFLFGRPTIRCLHLSLPANLKPLNKLEVSMFKFDSGTFDSAEKKILEGWIAWENRWREGGVEASGSWLEDNTSPYESQNKIFPILAWYWEDEVLIKENEIGKLKNEFEEAFTTAGAKDITREIDFQKYDSTFSTKPIESLASLLQIAPPRRHKETLVTTERYHDSKHIESVYSAAVGNRKYPAPRGTYMKMGNLHESMFLDPGSEASTRIRNSPDTELLWLKFEPGRFSIGNSISEILVEPRGCMSKDVGYRVSLY